MNSIWQIYFQRIHLQCCIFKISIKSQLCGRKINLGTVNVLQSSAKFSRQQQLHVLAFVTLELHSVECIPIYYPRITLSRVHTST